MNQPNDTPDDSRGDSRDNSTGDRAEREQFRRLVDDRLSAEEFAALEQRLLADRDFRARYIRFADLEAALYEAMLAEPEAVRPRDASTGGKSQRRALRFVTWSLAASVALGLIGLVGYWNWPVAAPVAQPGTGYLEIPLQGMEVAAIVTHVEGLGPQRPGGEIKPGLRLKPGSLTVERGQVQVEFLGGAKLLVRGPAELHILTPKSATLVSGVAATRVLQWGHGFVLNTPAAALVDLGTEFAVSVDETQGSEVRVVDGEVEVSVLGEDGSTLISERIVEDNARRVAPGSKRLESTDGLELLASGLELYDRPTKPLAVPQRYIDAVLAAGPVLYWRFETQDAEGLVPNELGQQLAARVEGSQLDPRAIRIHSGALQLAASETPRFIAAAQAIPKLNEQSFSLEFWANPDMLHWATLAAIVPEDDAPALQHLNVLELAHQTTLVHQAGAFRFMHRHPPKKAGGVNVFTKDGCIPGHWHHVVAVKTPESLRFYTNGQLQRQLDGPMGSDPGSYRVFLGQLRTSTAERQFVGAIDEVALYLKALDDNEVRGHYDAMFGRSGGRP